MEEKQPGQQPEADRKSDDTQQNRAARAGGKAVGGLAPTAQDRELVEEADRRGAETAEVLNAGGFGDHKGVEGFPGSDRSE